MSSFLKSVVVGDKHKTQNSFPNESEKETLASIQNLVTTSFTIEEHEPLLKELWNELIGLLPEEHSGFSFDDFEQVSDAWTSFGFQRADPVSDIRGGGVLCIKQLIYFLKEHNEVAQGMLARQRKHEHSRKSIETIGISKCYPFAAASINVTRVVAQAFGLVGGAGNKTDFTLQQKSCWALSDEYDEVYCVVFRLMDSVWTEMDADYMQFSAVLDEVKKRLSRVLLSGPQTCYDVEVRLFNNKLLYSEVIYKGWMEKTPQTSKTFSLRSPRSFANWQKRYFILLKTSPVRCMVQYFKSEKEAEASIAEHKVENFDMQESSLASTNGTPLHAGVGTPRGRIVLSTNSLVRRVGHNLFILDSDPFKLQLRTSHREETEEWVTHLAKAIEQIKGTHQLELDSQKHALHPSENNGACDKAAEEGGSP